MIKNGIGLHIEYLGPDLTAVYHNFFLGLWIAELFYTFALTPAKLSFLAFYWRVFRVSSIKLPIKIMATIVIVWSVVRVSISCSLLSVVIWTEPLTGRGDYMSLYPGSRLLGQVHTGNLHR